MSSLIVVGTYFTRKRALATGIATSGSGLGTFAYAYMTNVLLGEFDWKGTVLILSAVILNIVVCGAVYRPLKANDRGSERSSSTEITRDIVDIKEYDESGKLLPVPVNTSVPKLNKLDRMNFLKTSELDPPQRLYVSSEDVASHYHESKYSKQYLSQRDFRDLDTELENTRHRHPSHHSSRYLLRPMSRKDIFYSGSLARLPHPCDTAESASLDPSELSEDSEETDETIIAKMKKTLISNVSLFKDKIFILLLFVNVFWTGKILFLFKVIFGVISSPTLMYAFRDVKRGWIVFCIFKL